MEEQYSSNDNPQEKSSYMNTIIATICIFVVHYQLNYKESGCKDSEIISVNTSI